jgi:hypothetical protein
MKPGISVHHMVLNPPIDRLALLVEYLRPYVNEFVIVDTGSSHEDIETMASWSTEAAPVRIFCEPFVNFSETRNKGIERHEYEWTLHLDPDELPNALMLSHIVWATKDGAEQFPQAQGWLYWTVNFWGGRLGVEKEYHWHTRLFKTEGGQFYKPVHEQVRLYGKEESETRNTSFLPKAPKAAYLIHSKPGDVIERDDALYAALGEVSK